MATDGHAAKVRKPSTGNPGRYVFVPDAATTERLLRWLKRKLA